LAQQEAALVQELEKRKSDAVREEKLIQRIREESEELRELESKLKAAYVSKERAQQLAEAEHKREQERVRAGGAGRARGLSGAGPCSNDSLRWTRR
jgi:hypothetical protein